jgi:hypothetical protein
MVSSQVISTLKNAATQVSSVRLTAEEEQKVERFAEELRLILDAARLRAY